MVSIVDADMVSTDFAKPLGGIFDEYFIKISLIVLKPRLLGRQDLVFFGRERYPFRQGGT